MLWPLLDKERSSLEIGLGNLIWNRKASETLNIETPKQVDEIKLTLSNGLNINPQLIYNVSTYKGMILEGIILLHINCILIYTKFHTNFGADPFTDVSVYCF